MNWEKLDPKNYMTGEQITEGIANTRHRLMFRDETQID